jgi:hypothetical protein
LEASVNKRKPQFEVLKLKRREENAKGSIELLAACYLLFKMGTQPLVIVRVIVSLPVLLSVAALNDLGYTVERYD